jgi:hypothetical protein
MNRSQTKMRLPAPGFVCSVISITLVLSGIACGEKTTEAKAPAPAVAPSPEPAPAAAADTAAALPEAIRAQLPAGAALRELIAGDGAIVPPVGGGESHQRHPYDLPAGAAGIVAFVRWQDTAWKEVEIAIGIGLCPHRGRKLESARGSEGVAALHHAVQADEALVEDKWFLHVNADEGLTANPGKRLPYSYTVYSY